jgi:hypothetical protein
MSDRLKFDLTRTGKKWVAYFDLLGFGELVKHSNIADVFYRWEQCLNEFRSNLNQHPDLEFANFSDTFLIYAPDDSKKSFGKIDICARYFFEHVVQRLFPLRGALACDDFYADKPNGVFLGKALVTAHDFGEQFDWIGYTLSPSALCRMHELGLHECGSHFRKSVVPTKSGSLETIALLPGSGTGGPHICALEQMRQSALDFMARKNSPPEQIRRVADKYDNAMLFIRRFEMKR